MSEGATPQLAPPGAGIPWPQRLLLRHIVKPLIAARSDWEADSRRFDKVTQQLLGILADAPAAKLEKRVLVPPQRGLEDSSRFWSVAMTLQHMAIVGNGISGIIVSLSQGVVPARVADTAAVKPQDNAPYAENFEKFRAFSLVAIRDIDAAVKDRAAKARFKHPWFGGMTAHEWHWLLGIHQGLHFQQIREILKRA